MISEAGLKRSFDSYFIDYAFMNDVSEAGHHRVFHSSAISTTKHSVEIEDDCLVYSVVLGVVLKNESECANVLYSSPKFLWVRYYLDYLETFTNRIDKITAEEIKSAFQRRVDMSKFSSVIVGSE